MMVGVEPRGRRVFISFVGLGSPPTTPEDWKKVGYEKADYNFGEVSYTSAFSQRAVLEALGGATFDAVHLLLSDQSKTRHWDHLRAELVSIGVSLANIHPHPVVQENQQDPDDQWGWFERLLALIEPGDRVTFDVTHGFRSVPIVFATAIGYLQKAHDFTLEHVHYGFLEGTRADTPRRGRMVDLAEFFEINRWADAVSALVDGADATALARLIDDPGSRRFKALRDEALVEALHDLTQAIKDVDMNGVARRAGAALGLVKTLRDAPGTSAAERQLLELVLNKFATLGRAPGNGTFDEPFFRTQLALAGVLLAHGLNMQAYTVLYETIASIGMLRAPDKHRGKSRTSSIGRDARRRFADTFLTMCKYPGLAWNASSPERERDREALLPYWDALTAITVAPDGQASTTALHELAARVGDVRDRLHHGWTAAGKPDPDIAAKAQGLLQDLSAILDALSTHGFFDPTRPIPTPCDVSTTEAGA